MFEVRFQCESMPYMYAALYSLQTVCFRLPLHLPSGLHGMIVVYCYSVWWSEETHSERWGAGETPRGIARTCTCSSLSPYFAQLLLRPSSWTWSAYVFVLKRTHAVVAFAKSSIWTPQGRGEGAFFSLNTVSSHRLLSLPQWPADCELGFNLRTLGFFAFLLRSLLLVRCCETLGWKRYTSRNGVYCFVFFSKSVRRCQRQSLVARGH